MKIEGELPELLETSSLEAVTQFELELQTQKEPPPARRPAAVEYRDEAGRR